MSIRGFIIESDDGHARLELSGDFPWVETAYETMITFEAKFVSVDLTARIEVVDTHSAPWVTYFDDLAESWKGWTGDKAHESLEHHLRIGAICDSAGHIELCVRLHEYSLEPEWTMEGRIEIVAGNLDELARQARSFFDPRGS